MSSSAWSSPSGGSAFPLLDRELELDVFRDLQKPDKGVRSRNALDLRTVLVGTVGVVDPLAGGESISILGPSGVADVSPELRVLLSRLSGSVTVTAGASAGDCRAEIVVEAMLAARW